MAEAEQGVNQNDELVKTLDDGDLVTGVYEGGFKTWECATDLAGLLHTSSSRYLSPEVDLHVIELGCGSSMPSLALLQTLLAGKLGSSRRITFHFCDYNEAVLKLVTLPNLLLTWWLARASKSDANLEGEMDNVDQSTWREFRQTLAEHNIEIGFVSGGWGSEFCKIVSQDIKSTDTRVLLLASETVYSPASLMPFIDSAFHLLHKGNSTSQLLFASKKIYFGVGGTADDVVREVKSRAAQVEQILDVKDSGVGRVIFDISL